MRRKCIFNPETDSEKVAMDIVRFLKKWGLWKDVRIFTGGKCYSDGVNAELQIKDEKCPEKYTSGFSETWNCTGEPEYIDFSNPERLLDMTFEGPLSLLLRHREYEVCIGEVSEEVRHILLPRTNEYQDEVAELMDEYLEGKIGWDPAEYDSYEEWLELNQYCDMDEFYAESYNSEIELSSREEYEVYLLLNATVREERINAYFEDYLCNNSDHTHEMFFDAGTIADRIINEFDELLESYGLWYDLGFSWSLTTYRI